MSRTENSLKNIKYALFFQAASILVAFFTRKVFVVVLSAEYLGLEGTFSNILSMLSLAEMGVGMAVSYSLYKPLAEGDQEQIASLMALYKWIYRAIGFVVAALGCGLAPFLPVLIRDFPDIPHIYVIYLLFVLNSALSYFCVYKQLLISADQRQYIITICRYGLKMLLSLLQALFLWFTRNYFVYLALQIGVTLAENLFLSYRAGQLYPQLRSISPKPLDAEHRRDILRNARAVMAHKIGGVVVSGTDNLLISFFVGVVAVGLYSNYLMVTKGLETVYDLLFRSLTGSVGNLGATEGADHSAEVFRRINFVSCWLYGFSAVCLTVLLNPFIDLWLGERYLFNQWIIYAIAANFYVSGMRRPVLTFRDAYGLYWYDRHKPIFEALINLTVSAALAVPFGVAGILMGTIVGVLATGFWVEPLVLYRYGLKAPVGPYFACYIKNTLLTLLAGIVTYAMCDLLPGSGLPLFVGKMAVCALLPNLIFLAAYWRMPELRYYIGLARKLLRLCCKNG